MSSRRNELVDLELCILAYTAKAILASDDGEESNAKWLPMSMIEIDPPDLVRGEERVVTLPLWKAEELGLV